jgi:hypothetical protein
MRLEADAVWAEEIDEEEIDEGDRRVTISW